MTEPKPLTPADPADLEEAIFYALRFGLTGKAHRKRIREDPRWMARHIVEHLARANYRFMKGPPLPNHSTSDFGANPGGLPDGWRE
ncbi:hypothetical protein SAMN02745194_03161 [Roseomonas rosea]|uniref:Uncharacterized protein n=1 Tax=Muricoccus roseus TaxID=198092 RepID=A0A1M6LG41_9PROT|nr:hypothetical protein [Roseomonas rosea]SHJ70078.1 hypothetical protein SAMN02745194_03161 [Roseomonas rosea]